MKNRLSYFAMLVGLATTLSFAQNNTQAVADNPNWGFAEENVTVGDWSGKYGEKTNLLEIEPNLSFQYAIKIGGRDSSCEIKGTFELLNNSLKFSDSECLLEFTHTQGKYYNLDITGCQKHCTPNGFYIPGIMDKM